MILRANKILLVHLKIKKKDGMVIFISMKAVNNYAPQPSNARAQNRKRTSVRSKKFWSRSILRQRNYVQQTET